MRFSLGYSLNKGHQKLKKTGHWQRKNLQSPSRSLKPGGAITWSVCVQTKPVVTTTAKIIISPVRSTRRVGNTFGETDGVFDMAYSFLYGKQTRYIDRVIECDFRIACVLIAVCLLVNRLSVI
jgi:hypothetical protein